MVRLGSIGDQHGRDLSVTHSGADQTGGPILGHGQAVSLKASAPRPNWRGAGDRSWRRCSQHDQSRKQRNNKRPSLELKQRRHVTPLDPNFMPSTLGQMTG